MIGLKSYPIGPRAEPAADQKRGSKRESRGPKALWRGSGARSPGVTPPVHRPRPTTEQKRKSPARTGIREGSRHRKPAETLRGPNSGGVTNLRKSLENAKRKIDFFRFCIFKADAGNGTYSLRKKQCKECLMA